jgi:hypothetical protein
MTFPGGRWAKSWNSGHLSSSPEPYALSASSCAPVSATFMSYRNLKVKVLKPQGLCTCSNLEMLFTRTATLFTLSLTSGVYSNLVFSVRPSLRSSLYSQPWCLPSYPCFGFVLCPYTILHTSLLHFLMSVFLIIKKLCEVKKLCSFGSPCLRHRRARDICCYWMNHVSSHCSLFCHILYPTHLQILLALCSKWTQNTTSFFLN